MTRAEFIQDMRNNIDELTTSDLQGIVEARCMQTGENEDDLLNEILEMEELKEGMKVTRYFFFSETYGVIARIERNRINPVLGKLPDVVFVKFEDEENETSYNLDQIKFEKPERWNGNGTFVEKI